MTSEFWGFFMLLSNVFTVDLYFFFCMFVLIRPIFVSTVCEVLSTLRAGDAQGKSYDTVFCYHVVRPRGRPGARVQIQIRLYPYCEYNKNTAHKFPRLFSF